MRRSRPSRDSTPPPPFTLVLTKKTEVVGGEVAYAFTEEDLGSRVYVKDNAVRSSFDGGRISSDQRQRGAARESNALFKLTTEWGKKGLEKIG